MTNFVDLIKVDRFVHRARAGGALAHERVPAAPATCLGARRLECYQHHDAPSGDPAAETSSSRHDEEGACSAGTTHWPRGAGAKAAAPAPCRTTPAPPRASRLGTRRAAKAADNSVGPPIRRTSDTSEVGEPVAAWRVVMEFRVLSGFPRRPRGGFPIGVPVVQSNFYPASNRRVDLSGATPCIAAGSLVFVFRRLAALFVALLLLQTNWQSSGAVCLTGHAASHGGLNAMPAATAGAEPGVTATPATTHDGMTAMAPAHRASAEVPAAPTPPSISSEETAPSGCPDARMPEGCISMPACSIATLWTAGAPSLATDDRNTSERVETEIRLRSRDVAPDVPPPRA